MSGSGLVETKAVASCEGRKSLGPSSDSGEMKLILDDPCTNSTDMWSSERNEHDDHEMYKCGVDNDRGEQRHGRRNGSILMAMPADNIPIQ